MINIDLALKTILAQINPLRSEITPASSTMLGTCIAEDIYADIASPPFDKSIVDGFALINIIMHTISKANRTMSSKGDPSFDRS